MAFILWDYFQTGSLSRGRTLIGEISCLKENGVAHDTLKDVQEMWENPLKLDLASQKENEELDQLYLDECVIDNE